MGSNFFKAYLIQFDWLNTTNQVIERIFFLIFVPIGVYILRNVPADQILQSCQMIPYIWQNKRDRLKSCLQTVKSLMYW